MRRLANEAYKLFSKNPHHPSLRFKQVHPSLPLYSIRIGFHYRALGIMPKPGEIVGHWIGSHADYDQLI